ncbi:gluconokinase [Maribacter sp. 2307ULW6-5]|uniref:gluconokinase n=1 Tax=Maribacter sp. 2307ULW6-5 TaxID=3386275 RepID=UPI0039BCA281
MNRPRIVYVMGVSGSGKSTVGKLLAKDLGIPFFDGDDYHPKANIDKMAGGRPLNDADRAPWLCRLNGLAKEHQTSGAVIVCSALKERYRTILVEGLANMAVFVHLSGSMDQIMNRLKDRTGHFMPRALLQSQFDALEPPKDAIEVSIGHTPQQLVRQITTVLKA